MGLVVCSPKMQPPQVLREDVAVVEEDEEVRAHQFSNVFEMCIPFPPSSLHNMFAKTFWFLEAWPSARPEVNEVAAAAPLWMFASMPMRTVPPQAADHVAHVLDVNFDLVVTDVDRRGEVAGDDAQDDPLPHAEVGAHTPAS